MKENVFLPWLAGALLISCMVGCTQSQSSLEAKAKIGRADAEKLALARVPGGTITEGELEEEGGRVVWSFDIASPGTTDLKELWVDAETGVILKTETETADQEAKEKE
jgi:uncharacterized membrane protein YkoI